MADDKTPTPHQALTQAVPANLTHPLKFSQYTPKHWLTLAVFIVTIIFAVVSLSYFLGPNFPDTRLKFTGDTFAKFVVFFWTLAPPAWFFIEFFFIWAGATDADLKRVQDGQKLAQPFWAALLATLLFLIPK